VIVNLTPHTINVFDGDGRHVIDVPPSGTVARVNTQRTVTGAHEGVSLYRATYGAVQELPEAVPGTIFVTSALVRAAVARDDVWQPGELLRDDAGRPVGCIGLSQ